MPDMERQMELHIRRSIERTLAEMSFWVLSMQDMGMSSDAIKGLVKADLSTGGRVFGEFKNAIKNDVAYGVNAVMTASMMKVYEEAEIEKLRWVTEPGMAIKGESCPDCALREGEINTMEGWEAAGLPQSGFSVCRDNCHCRLEAVNG